MKRLFTLVLGLVVSVAGFSQQRNCATMQNLERLKALYPEIEQHMAEIEYQTEEFQNSGSRDINAVYSIPVVVHVLYNTTSQNISDAQIKSQIDVLNEDFRRLNADKVNTPSAHATVAADAEISFCLATVDPNGNPTTGITRTQTSVTSFTSNDAMKYSSSGGKDAWNTSKYLNLWVCNLGGGLLGYAQFPGGPAATDGVVINYQYFGRGYSTVAPYNKGRTGTHEVGHWLNLRHIWGDASCGNDYVSDTPTQQTSNYGCPSYPHVTCSNGTAGDQFMNYMDYVDDGCMNMFSLGQKTRMRALFASTGSRYSLLSSAGCGSAPTTSCGTPANLSAGSLTTSSATLSWAAVTGASSYNLRYRKVATTTWSTTTSASTSKSISALTAGTTYEFQVQAVCSGTSGAYSASKQFSTTNSSTTTTTTLSIGTGTSTFQAPFGTYYMDEKSQFIITKTELVNAGWTSTKNQLKSLAFNVATNAGQVMNGFSIKIRHTTSSTFSSGFYSATNMVTVYSANVTPVTGWNTFNFTTPFTYNGVDHLLIEICWDNSSYTSDTKVYASSLSGYQTIYKQSDVTSGGVCATTTGTLSYLRPNVRIICAPSSITAARTIGENETEATLISSLNLYPNPAKDVLYLDLSLAQDANNVSIEMFSMMGQKVFSREFTSVTTGDHNLKFDLNNEYALPSGLYIINITVDGKSDTRKVIIAD